MDGLIFYTCSCGRSFTSQRGYSLHRGWCSAPKKAPSNGNESSEQPSIPEADDESSEQPSIPEADDESSVTTVSSNEESSQQQPKEEDPDSSDEDS